MSMPAIIPQPTLITLAARSPVCPCCWALPGKPCTVSWPPGDHLARYQQAERAGLIDRDQLAAVVAGLTVIAGHVVIAEGRAA